MLARSKPPCSRATRGWLRFGGFFNFDSKVRRVAAIDAELQLPAVWNDLTKSQQLQKERQQLAKTIDEISQLTARIADAGELLELAVAENDAAVQAEVRDETAAIAAAVEALNFRRLFAGEFDAGDAFLTVQAGSGGTEAQDWAAMLLRMYLRYAENMNFDAQVLEETPAEVAGIKGATVRLAGSYAYGYLRLETGIHRLVRKSPFDSNHKRHTSFASIFVFPVIEDNVEVSINPADLRIDTYRSSGAGGQHVNTTDSAVRITHLPTNIVVQCQNDRSQHKNRAEAMSMLRARLHQHEMDLRTAEKNEIESSKAGITWGQQIRSYVLDQSRIKDLRSGYESGNPRAVLDGDLAPFIRAELLMTGKD